MCRAWKSFRRVFILAVFDYQDSLMERNRKIFELDVGQPPVNHGNKSGSGFTHVPWGPLGHEWGCWTQVPAGSVP